MSWLQLISSECLWLESDLTSEWHPISQVCFPWSWDRLWYIKRLRQTATYRQKASTVSVQYQCIHSSELHLFLRPQSELSDFLLTVGSLLGLKGVGLFLMYHCPLSSRPSMVKGTLCFSFSLSFNVRPLLSRSRQLSSPSCRCRSEDSGLCPPKTPASAHILASRTACIARRCVAGQRRWMNMGTRCTSATILTRRYRPFSAGLLSI